MDCNLYLHSPKDSKLTYYYEVDVSGNYLSGTFPEQIVELPHLSLLFVPTLTYELIKWMILNDQRNIAENEFTGSIPDQIGKLTSLRNFVIEMVIISLCYD